jgi:starch synthase
MRVAILPWGGVIEDYLDSIGISVREFAEEMSGGWLFGYVDALASRGIESCVVCFSSRVKSPAQWQNRASGCSVIVLPTSLPYRLLRRFPGDPDSGVVRTGRVLGRLQAVSQYFATPGRRLTAVLRREGCSHILCQEYEGARFVRASRIGRKMGLPVFASFQGGFPAHYRLDRQLRRRAIAQAAGLIICSHDERARVLREYRVEEQKVCSAPNPLDTRDWQPVPRGEARAALQIDQAALVVICHGRIDIHRKGLDVLMDAWRRLYAQSKGSDLRLHLIGSGQDDARLRDLIERQPVPGLVWQERYILDRQHLRNALCAADIYVMASRHEGFPVAPLEAMACGLPVVATEAPGIREIFAAGEADGGVVVESGNADALAAGLEVLLEDPERRSRVALAARERIESFASLEAVGLELATCLSS